MNPPRLLVLALIIELGAGSVLGQQSPTDDDFVRGQEALRARKYHDAIDAFKKSQKREHETCADCSLGLAIAYFRLGDRDGALKNSDRLISLATDDTRRAAGHNLKGQTWLRIDPDSKTLAKAEAEFREALKLAPGSVDFHLNLAQALLKQSKDDGAVSELRQCLALNPDPATTELVKKLIADPIRGREELAPEFELTTLQASGFP